ncbi:MAG: HPF/RaiA family ribosome-associated protein [Anaerolineae bacterium]
MGLGATDFDRFDYEFLNETERPDEPLRTEMREQLLELAADHKDMIGASVALEELSGSSTPHQFQARIVVYMRPDNVVAVEKGKTAILATQQAMKTIERQIREERTKRRETWKQP